MKEKTQDIIFTIFFGFDISTPMGAARCMAEAFFQWSRTELQWQTVVKKK
jgi:hypothetical protein